MVFGIRACSWSDSGCVVCTAMAMRRFVRRACSIRHCSLDFPGSCPSCGWPTTRTRFIAGSTTGTGPDPLCPDGAVGLVLLASGRYTETDVNIPQLLHQAGALRGFWVGLAQLPRSHPFTIRRLQHLFNLGFFQLDRHPSTTQASASAS